MAKRGTKPTPTALKVFRGNPGKRKLNEREPRPSPNFPPCPERLAGVARETWEKFSEALTACGVGTQLDGTALETLCEAYALYVEAAANVAKGGAVWITSPKPGELPTFVYSPYWCVMKNQWKIVSTMLAEFGMTPSSRVNLEIETRPQDNAKARFIK